MKKIADWLIDFLFDEFNLGAVYLFIFIFFGISYLIYKLINIF